MQRFLHFLLQTGEQGQAVWQAGALAEPLNWMTPHALIRKMLPRRSLEVGDLWVVSCRKPGHFFVCLLLLIHKPQELKQQTWKPEADTPPQRIEVLRIVT